jgi:hypothetical protein
MGSPLRHDLSRPKAGEALKNTSRIENLLIERILFNIKSRITEAEVTVVLMLNEAASRDWAVFNPGGLFLFLFWASKKENNVCRVQSLANAILYTSIITRSFRSVGHRPGKE